MRTNKFSEKIFPLTKSPVENPDEVGFEATHQSSSSDEQILKNINRAQRLNSNKNGLRNSMHNS